MQIEHRALLPFKIIDHANLPLREGANIVGKVLKLLPDGLMELQVGQRVLTAGTTAELKEGNMYRFQVVSAEGQPVLKIISTESVPQKSALPQLLDSFLQRQTVPTAETRELLRQIGQPVTEGEAKQLKHALTELVQLAKGDETGRTLDRKTSDQILAQQLVQATNEAGKGVYLFQLPQFGPFEDVDLMMEAPFERTFDPNHARVVLYLQLPTLGEVAVDVLIADRNVSISVFHPNAHVNTFMQAYTSQIQTRLEEQGYALTRFDWVEQTKERVPLDISTRNGRVDLHI